MSLTRFYTTEWKEYYPTLDFSGALFFGMSLGDEAWGITTQGKERVIPYHHQVGDALGGGRVPHPRCLPG